MDTDCDPNTQLNSCLEFYEGLFVGENEDGEQLRFPDTGSQCLFRESLFPIKPWQKVTVEDFEKGETACKIYQADDICSTYEISDEGNYIISCDLALNPGSDECFAKKSEQFICLEFCPEEGCVSLGAAKLVASAGLLVLFSML